MDKELGVITVTMNNLSVEASEKVEIQLANRGYHVTEAKIVTDSDMHAHNTFEAPDTVTEKDFTAYEETENGVNVTMPANSVIELTSCKIRKKLSEMAGKLAAGYTGNMNSNENYRRR